MILSARHHHTYRERYMTDCFVAQILASASYDDTIKFYIDDPSDDWFCAATVTGHDSTVWSLAWEPEHGHYLASGSDDHTIRIWRRLPTKGELKFECIAVLEGHDRSVYSISWGKAPPSAKDEPSKEGQFNIGWLASTGGDGTILVWQINVRKSTIQQDVTLTCAYRKYSRNHKGPLDLSTRL
jgi:cytosolic iron-sulfur protein assembly protein CIAO1